MTTKFKLKPDQEIFASVSRGCNGRYRLTVYISYRGMMVQPLSAARNCGAGPTFDTFKKAEAFAKRNWPEIKNVLNQYS